MKNKGFKGKILSNLIWRFSERCGAQLIQAVVSIILARILGPDAYGAIALVMVVSNILQVFVDEGLGNALIQKENSDDLDFSSVFYFNMILCLFLYGVIYLMAPYIAVFLGDQEFTGIIRVLCLTVIISGLKNVQQAYISKTLQFRLFFFATIVGTLISAVIGITMAFMGFGMWALVMQKLSNLIIDTAMLWIMVRWRPKLLFSFERLIQLIKYGWKLVVASFVDKIYDEIGQIAIGKAYTNADLSFYNQARQYSRLIGNNINVSLNSVLFPVLSSVQNDKKRIKSMVQRTVTTGTFIMSPVFIGMAVTAPDWIPVILTDEWLPIIPFLYIFCSAYLLLPASMANLNAIKALGRSDITLKMQLIKKGIGIILIIMAVPVSVYAVADVALIMNILSYIINARSSKKLLDYGYMEQMKDVLKTLWISLVMGVLVFFIGQFPLSHGILLLVQIIMGIFIYIILAVITRNDSLALLWREFHSLHNLEIGKNANE